MLAIYKREMKAYFITPLGYVFLGVFLLVSGFVFCFTTLYQMTSDLTEYFSTMLLCFIILLPLLTMKLFTEEKRARTEQLLLTAPVSVASIVGAKFLAAYTMFAGSTVFSGLYFIFLSFFGNVQIGLLFGNLLAVLLIGMAFIAVGVFVSAITETQLSAAILTIGVIAAMVGLNLINSLTDSAGEPLIGNYAVRFVLDWFSVVGRFANFRSGLFDYTSLIYYASLSFVFLFLTVRVYEKRRWG